MTVYKESLNLPKTAFPMKASLAQREPKMLATWEQQGLYQQIREHCAGREKFILHDGPPYANGHLHCGHALNKILKDIIVKSKTLSGFDAPYVPGWDCHGLPIELNVEKKVGKAGVKVSHAEFRQRCRDYAKTQIDVQREEFKRLGVLGDWENPYVTMDYNYEANVIRSLAKVVENGHLKQGFKPVHWCVNCGSALAEAEVEYEDKESPSIDVRFPIVDRSDLCQRLDISPSNLEALPLSVVIWTTTPWTLPANEGVSVNPHIDYVLVLVERAGHKEYLLLAKDLCETVMQRINADSFQIVSQFSGEPLDQLQLQHPFYDRQVPMLLAFHVTVETGTGCVHTAPAHGPDDYQVGQRYDLPVNNPVLANGCFADSVELFAGKHVSKVAADVLGALESRNHLLHSDSLKHSYPHCWRHKTPVIFRATPQWFIAMEQEGLRQMTMHAINEIEWIPGWGKARIHGMVDGRPDWCISRQRSWGSPITLFVHKETRELAPNTPALMEAVAKKVEQQGIDAWFDLDPAELLGDKASEYDKVTDTLDVWFDSGVTHYCVVKQREELHYPADLYLEGSDQHRGWFNSSLTSAMAMYGQAPYKAVLTHGYTVDAQGRKMSKSKGNVITPDQLIKQSGADILRLWVASSDYRNELNISDEILKRNADAYRRIRNTSRFLLANLFDFDPQQHSVAGQELLALDKWAIQLVKDLQGELLQAYDDYQFHVIYQKIHNFCTNEMGGFYLDIIKDRQYTTQRDSVARRSCQTAMYHILEALVRWLTPILSFTADEIWGYMPGERSTSVFLTTWYQDFPDFNAADVDMTYWQEISTVRNAINKALESKRKSIGLGSGLEAEVTLFVSLDLHHMLDKIGNELRFVLMTSSAKIESLDNRTEAAEPTDREDLFLLISTSSHEKCERCWHRLPSVGQDELHPSLCERCIDNIGELGEQRQFA